MIASKGDRRAVPSMSNRSTRAAAKVRRFLRHERGATAVEFAILALPFFTLLFGVLELGLLFMASTILDAATLTAARHIRTGAMQASSANTAAGFKADVCNNMSWLSSSDCTANVVVDVRTFASFGTISSSPPVTNGAIDSTKTTYDAGVACSIVLVRVFYPYALYTPLLDPGLPNLGPTHRLITSAAAFRNENYSGALPCS